MTSKEIAERVLELHSQNPDFSAQDIVEELREEGVADLSRSTVQRIIRKYDTPMASANISSNPQPFEQHTETVKQTRIQETNTEGRKVTSISDNTVDHRPLKAEYTSISHRYSWAERGRRQEETEEHRLARLREEQEREAMVKRWEAEDEIERKRQAEVQRKRNQEEDERYRRVQPWWDLAFPLTLIIVITVPVLVGIIAYGAYYHRPFYDLDIVFIVLVVEIAARTLVALKVRLIIHP